MKYTRENYEEYALDYLENIMNPGEKKEFETFLLLNPEIREELNEFKWVEVTPDLDLGFPDLNKLKRTSTPQAKIISSKFLLRAAAAILLLLVMSVVFINRNPTTDLVTSENIQKDETNPSLNEVEQPLPSDEIIAAEVENGKVLESKTDANFDKPDIVMEDKVAMVGEVEVVEQIAAIDLTAENHLLDPKSTAIINDDKLDEEIIKSSDDRYVPVPKIAAAKFDALVFDRAIDEKYLPGIQPYLEEEEGKSKVAKFFAKANFIPSTLLDIDKDELKEKFIPESFYSR